jgi:hypothetical protein
MRALGVAGAPGQVPPQHAIMPLPLQAGQMPLEFGAAALLFMAAPSAVAPTWWPSPDRRRSPPGAGAVKGLIRRTSKMLWPCGSAWDARVYACGGERPKDLGTLDGSRGGLILPRRVKVTPQHRPSTALGRYTSD